MTQFFTEPVTDSSGNKWWIVFEHGRFCRPTAVVPDANMVSIANKVLGRGLSERPSMPDLRVLRKRAGLTLKDVSAATGISVSYLSDLERGSRGVYTVTEKVGKVIDYLNEVKR